MYQEYLHHKNTPMCVCIYLHEYECVYVSIFIHVHVYISFLFFVSFRCLTQVRIRQAQEAVSDPDSPDKKMGSPKLSKLSCPEAER